MLLWISVYQRVNVTTSKSYALARISSHSLKDSKPEKRNCFRVFVCFSRARLAWWYSGFRMWFKKCKIRSTVSDEEPRKTVKIYRFLDFVERNQLKKALKSPQDPSSVRKNVDENINRPNEFQTSICSRYHVFVIWILNSIVSSWNFEIVSGIKCDGSKE